MRKSVGIVVVAIVLAAAAFFSIRSQSDRPTESPEAYRLSLLARYFRNRETEAGSFEKASHYYREAIREDPSYAAAHAGLAEVYMGMDRWGATTIRAEEAENAARRALDLDSALPDAHVAMGMVLQLYRRDYGGAEVAFRTALGLNPNHANARREHGLLLLRRLGRLDEALTELQRAQNLDPLSRQANSNLAEAYRARGEYNRAIEAMAHRIELDPRTVRGLANMAYAWLALDDRAGATEWSARALELQPGFAPALQLQAYISLSEENLDRAGEIGRWLVASHPEDPHSLAAAGLVALRTGDWAQARRHLEQACRLGPDGWAWPLDVRPATLLGYVLLGMGEEAEADGWLSESLRLDSEVPAGSERNRPLPSWLHNSALVHAVRGDRDGACQWLGRAVEAGWRAWAFNRAHPLWDGLRDAPCVRELATGIEVDLARMRERLGPFAGIWDPAGPGNLGRRRAVRTAL